MFDRYQREIHYLRLSVTDLCNLRCRYCRAVRRVGQRRLGHQRFALHKPRGRIGERGQLAADIHGLVVCLDGQFCLVDYKGSRAGNVLTFLRSLPVNHISTGSLLLDLCAVTGLAQAKLHIVIVGVVNDDGVILTVVSKGSVGNGDSG